MDPLRAMTFNVRYDTDEDAANDWSSRRDLVASTIRYHAPAVVGLQEPFAHQLDDLDESLPGYEWVGESRRAEAAVGEYAPIGYRTDRFALVETGTFWLSETPDEPGSVGWDAKLPRVATWARLADNGADRPLLHLNLHLDHEGERARREGAALVGEWLRDHADGTTPVVTGDFNCLAGDPPHAELDGLALGDGRHLEPAAAVAADRHGPDTSRTDFSALDPGRRIDHVFVPSDCRVRTHAVLTDRDDERYPSDHLPVVADVVDG